MKNPRAEAMARVISLHGYNIPAAFLAEALAVTEDEPIQLYENGDFVTVYEGMGEFGHGTVIGRTGDSYQIDSFLYGFPENSWKRTVRHSDMRGLSTPELAMEYFHKRTGGT